MAQRSNEIDDETLAWIEEVVGAPVEDVKKVPGGASRQSFFLGFAQSSIGREFFLRSDLGKGPMSGTIFTLEREARLLEALAGSAVRVPHIHASSRRHDAILMELVAGSSDYNGLIDPAARRRIECDLVEQLAVLHSLPIDVAALFGGAPGLSVRQALQDDIAVWRNQYRARVVPRDPLILFALDWLDRNASGGDRPAVLVHGDIGPGNFMFDETGITALIDWEIAHAGHPLEDIACIIARTLGVPFADPQTLIADYADASGRAVDRTELRYCLILVLTRFSIGIAMAITRGGTLIDLPMLLKFRQANLFALVSLLGEAEKLEAISLDEPTEPAADEAMSLHEYAVAVLDETAGGLADAYAAHRVRGIADLLRYLRNLHGDGGPPRDDAVAADPDFERWITGADDCARRDVLRDLFRASRRMHWLMRDALGPMFERRLVLKGE